MTIDGVEYVTVDQLMQQLTLARRWAERQVAGERARCAEIAREVPVASVEEIEINPVDLPNPPQRGDIVAAWGVAFTVTTVRQSDPYGMVLATLTLQPS